MPQCLSCYICAGLPSLDLSPVQEEQRDKWGCVPGAEYTQDIDMAAAGMTPCLLMCSCS